MTTATIVQLSDAHISIAETIHLKHEIFNCSLEDAWDKHLKPVIKEVNKAYKAEIIDYASTLSSQPPVKMEESSPNLKVGFRAIIDSKYLLQCEKSTKGGYAFTIYNKNKVIYRHPTLLPSTDVRNIIRKELGLRQTEINWKIYEEK